MPAPSTVPAEARDSILAWYAQRGRSLAFRATSDPYAILVAEFMAQQTQASRAAEHWGRFIERFPTFAALAAATPADVLRAWQGLGYDRRALALWRTAKTVMADHGGELPRTVEQLEGLPGIGPYTARAVAALAFGVPVGAVDVNVRRVIGRVVAGDTDILTRAALQTAADGSVPAAHPGAWTHALMDLGATTCRARAPKCDQCPASTWCRFAAGERPGGVRPRPPTTPRCARRRPEPFTSTTRWLRGRILDRLRAADDGAWVLLDEPIGRHDLARVQAAADAIAADGLIEVRGPGEAPGLHARLALD